MTGSADGSLLIALDAVSSACKTARLGTQLGPLKTRDHDGYEPGPIG